MSDTPFTDHLRKIGQTSGPTWELAKKRDRAAQEAARERETGRTGLIRDELRKAGIDPDTPNVALSPAKRAAAASIRTSAPRAVPGHESTLDYLAGLPLAGTGTPAAGESNWLPLGIAAVVLWLVMS